MQKRYYIKINISADAYMLKSYKPVQKVNKVYVQIAHTTHEYRPTNKNYFFYQHSIKKRTQSVSCII